MPVQPQRGFTLIELVITLLIAAILIAVGIPSFQNMIVNNRTTAIANELLTAVNFTRSEAIKQGTSVSMCPSANQTTCSGGTDWAAGFIVFLDFDANGTNGNGNNPCTVSASNVPTSDCLLRAWDAPKGTPTMTGPTSLRYTSAGNAAAAVNFTIKLPDCGIGQQRDLGVSAVGRAEITNSDCS